MTVVSRPAAPVAFLVVLALAVGWLGGWEPAPSVAGPLPFEASLTAEERAAAAAAEAAFAKRLAAQEAAFAAVDSLTSSETGRLRRSRNRAHVSAAARLGVAPVARDADVAGVRGLAPLDGASPYYLAWPETPLTPDALTALDRIGERFHAALADAGLPEAQFVVSSAFRTGEHQDRLRGTNANAARGRSSHEYGTTFDLAYKRYRLAPRAVERPPLPAWLPTLTRLWLGAEFDAMERAWAERVAAEQAGRLEAVLGRVLIGLEDEGALLALREVRQPCYHVTVARRLAR